MGDADMTADDAEHTLAMLDAGTFDLHLTAAARQRLSAPGRAARLDRVADVVAVGVTRRGD